ncbi:MAG: hypothetical protein AMJ94_01670 [Deltaproteobacteria bacterium SM23_61]|nr:MAG: hypothetical protein AMJ94_01670 [Deltaproteobacteria bacterium SM23_61]
MKFFPREMRSVYWPLWAIILLILAGCGGLKSENEKLKGEIVDASTEIAALHQEIQNLQKDVETFKTLLKSGDRKK